MTKIKKKSEKPMIEVKLVNHVLAAEVDAIAKEDGGSYELPKYATEGSAGLDLRACIKEPVEIKPGETKLIPSGIAINIKNPGIMAALMPRSGLGSKGLVLGNLTGVIDSDYQGEIKIALWNRTANATFTVKPGERICQMLFIPVLQVEFDFVDEFSEATERGAKGFGDSGVK